ncbi:MAG: Sua5/YciO/YrdC/YwlC family protein [Thiogranum sp.]|nr:Sua5/YciO/YrdC/YwlC family protein [Thiogranum sp.]
MSTNASEWRLHSAARVIRTGGVIAYPTEAVFGLGCDPANGRAVARLLELKHRPPDKGLILIASEWSQLSNWLQEISLVWQGRLDASWPGPVTWLIPAADHCPYWLTGDHETLAVRITDHPVVRALCNRLGSAIVSTSANRSGKKPARSLLEIRLQFGQQLDYVLAGALGGLSRPTEIRDLASGRIVR